MVFSRLGCVHASLPAGLDLCSGFFELFVTERFCDKPTKDSVTEGVQIITNAEPWPDRLGFYTKRIVAKTPSGQCRSQLGFAAAFARG